jgi:hypothetical protein
VARVLAAPRRIVRSALELFLICLASAISVATFFRLGLYRLVTRYISGRVEW